MKYVLYRALSTAGTLATILGVFGGLLYVSFWAVYLLGGLGK